MDSSVHLRSQGDSYPDNAVAVGDMGRYAAGSQINCTAWTQSGASSFGYVMQPSGMTQVLCSTTHALACCD
jgi:hypothetical protein